MTRRQRVVTSKIIVLFNLVLSLFVLTAIGTNILASRDVVPPSLQASGSDPELEAVLAQAAAYCDRLDRAVLNFVCRERIREWFRPMSRPNAAGGDMTIFTRRPEDHRYIYDLQLIRGSDGIASEKRTLLKEDRKEVRVVDAPLKTRAYWHSKIVMGPLGLLSRERQAEHDFAILRREKIQGDDVLVIKAVPKTGDTEQHLFGTVWLRKKDAGILKIDWNPASIDNYRLIVETADYLDMKVDLKVVSEYAFEKNGIRFPSRYTLREAYRQRAGVHSYRVGEIEVEYDEYKFFTVETDVKVERKGP